MGMTMTQLIRELEAGITATAADGFVVTMRTAGPAHARVVNVVSGPTGAEIHYQAPLSRAAISEAAAVASNLLAIHNL